MNGPQSPLDVWPPAASAAAVQSDHLLWIFTVVMVLLTAPVFIAITYFAFYYRHGRKVDRSNREPRSTVIELSWMIGPFLLTLIFFVWGAWLFNIEQNPPPNGYTINAIGRQWMWKFQYPSGQSEIDNLHVPTDQPIVIRMTSQDVIHSLYIPALRIQEEVLPNRYTELWFKANRPGVYHLYCSEYCGTDHSEMAGLLTIMTPLDFENWLTTSSTEQTLAAEGEAVFISYGCAGCHTGQSTVRAPSLVGLYGKPVPLASGGATIADDTYLEDKILDPNQQRVAGYKQVMPKYEGVLAKDDIRRLVAYVKSLNGSQGETQ